MGGAERVLIDLLGMLRRAEPSWPLGLIVGNDGPLVDAASSLGVDTLVLSFPADFARLGDSGLANLKRSPARSSPASEGPSGPLPLAAGWARFARLALGGSLGTMRYLKRLHGAIHDFHPDVVHSNGIKMHLLGSLAKPADAALVWHFHDYPSARPVTNRLIKALKYRCDSVIAVSDSLGQDLRTQVGSAIPVHTIWNSVDLHRFSPEGKSLDLDSLAGLAPADRSLPRLGMVATFARWKGHKLFLDMLALLKKTHSFRAFIIGGPLYETHDSQVTLEELRAAITRLDLTDVVGLTGFVPDAAAALRSLDVVVHASTSPEPFGLVIAEAMAAGRAVVISDSGGVAELVVPGETGLTYRAGDARLMAAAIARLLDDPALRGHLGRQAHAVAHHQFTQERMLRQMRDVYRSFDRAAAA
jgi:glycosyltransferase involved in cell wall biosynthesis